MTDPDVEPFGEEEELQDEDYNASFFRDIIELE